MQNDRINEAHENEIIRMIKPVMLIKLGFSVNFPQDMMRILKEILGLGLFLPSTMIVIQVLRLYLGNKRIKSNASRMIAVIEEEMWVEGGRN